MSGQAGAIEPSGVKDAGPAKDEDLIESTSRPRSASRRQAEAALHHRSVAAALLALGLVAGSIGGYLVGHNDPRTLAAVGFLSSFVPFEQTYGRPPLATLTSEDLSAIGEKVDRQLRVSSAQSAIPVLCGTGMGQPGTPSFFGLSYPAIVFGVVGGQLTELVWPQVDEATASGVLRTLVTLAQGCPEIPQLQATIATGGLLSGIGDEYAVFTRRPTSADQAAFTTTAALVRVGADVIEISFAADGTAVVDPESRCLQVAATAVRVAADA